jgi:hypothetical protein
VSVRCDLGSTILHSHPQTVWKAVDRNAVNCAVVPVAIAGGKHDLTMAKGAGCVG